MARIIARHRVYDGWYRFYRLEIRLPDGQVAERHLLDNGSAVAVLPYDAARRVVMLITQPRVGTLHAGVPPVLEAIAGCLDGAQPADQARKEAFEEGGLDLGELEPVANIWSLVPVSTERVMLYLAPYRAQDRIAEGGGAEDEDEHITVHEIGLDDLRAMVMGGQVEDAKTLILAQALILRHPELWD